MSKRPELKLIDTEQTVETAARWFAKRRVRTSASEEKKFSAWLQADAAHRRAYEDVTRSWEISAAGAGDPDIIAMRSDALMLPAEVQSRGSRFRGALATAALFLAIISLIGISDPRFIDMLAGRGGQTEQLALKTGIGQRSVAKLADGSVVTLNTNSALDVDYSGTSRHIRLLRGQAFFKVAKNARRPFIVTAGDRQVIALGTEFEVRLDDRKVSVALLEGRVRVRKASTDRQDLASSVRLASGEVLTPGERFVATADGSITAPANVANLVSWRTGRVRFDDTPLAEAVAEMNRYSQTQIIIADPAIAEIRISGSFRIGHSRSFSEMIASAFPVEADAEADVIRLQGA